DDARVTALLDRMKTPAVETTAAEPEDARPASPLPENVPHDALVGAARAIVWGGSIETKDADANARRRLGIGVGTVVEAGGGRTPAADRAAMEAIRAGSGPVVVSARAWEPPLLEFGDFIAALRARIGRDDSIIVTPIAGADAAIDDTQRQTWARAVGRAG